MKRLNDDGRAMMARVHSLAVVAMDAAAASTSPGPDIPQAKWESLPDPLRRRLARTLACISEHDATAPRATAVRSECAPGDKSRILSR